MQKILRACNEASPVLSLQAVSLSLSLSLSSVSTVAEVQFIPAAWIQAARWSACANAPPSCLCSSDSLSSAAESLPVSDTLKIHLLTGADTENQ